jgi:hypothetical protein
MVHLAQLGLDRVRCGTKSDGRRGVRPAERQLRVEIARVPPRCDMTPDTRSSGARTERYDYLFAGRCTPWLNGTQGWGSAGVRTVELAVEEGRESEPLLTGCLPERDT